jgi:enoyl-CoA hydratase/carnithine racemase
LIMPRIHFLSDSSIIMMSFQTIKVEDLADGTIVKVSLSRPKALNAMSPLFFTELAQAFKQIDQSKNVRVVILQAEGKLFTAGLDLKEAANLGIFNTGE